MSPAVWDLLGEPKREGRSGWGIGEEEVFLSTRLLMGCIRDSHLALGIKEEAKEGRCDQETLGKDPLILLLGRLSHQV